MSTDYSSQGPNHTGLASAGTTIVPSQPGSRAASLEKQRQQQDKALGNDGGLDATSNAGRPSVEVDQLKTAPARDPHQKDRVTATVLISCLSQSAAGLLFGWESGSIAGLLNCRDYQIRFGEADAASVTGYSIPTTRQSIITSFLGLGALFGSLLAGKISSKLGFKMANIISLVIFLIGIAVETSSIRQWGQIVAGRFIAGYGIGSLSMLAPLYQAECSPKQLRGTITSSYQALATLGIFFANVVNYSMHNRQGAISWRLTLALQFVWGGLYLAGTIMGPELPRYYVQRGDVEKARNGLAKLRNLPVDHPELIAELGELVRKDEEEKAAGDASYLDCFRGKDRMRRRTTVGIMVQAGQQWSGVNFFFSYGTKFFAAAGIADAFLIQMILGAVNVISTFPGMVAVEKFGRRRTLLIGAVIMFVGQVVAGALGTAYPDGEIAGKILITFSCIFIFGFASTWGPLGWVVAAEQFPLRMAPYCVAFATGSNWFNNFLLAIITPYLTDAGYANLQAKITFIWAGAIVLFGSFVFFFVPETKGLSLVQVDELYLSNVPARKSAAWVPFGGESKRNANDLEKAGSLKLGSGAKHREDVATRNLGDDDEE